MERRLNLGCGRDYRKGFINLDKNPELKLDYCWDIDEGLPFRDNYFDYVLARHVLEHVRDLIFTMREIYRVLKPRGLLEVFVPYFSFPSAFADPTHRRVFTLESFDYFNENHVFNYEIGKINFKILEKRLIFGRLPRSLGVGLLAKKFPAYYERYLAHVFPAYELHVRMEAIK